MNTNNCRKSDTSNDLLLLYGYLNKGDKWIVIFVEVENRDFRPWF